MIPLEVDSILNEITYRDWTFDLIVDATGQKSRTFIRVRFNAGDEGWQTGRKWYISPHMTKSEVVQTALKAVLAAEEHEAREAFRYKGSKIFGPHFDVDVLVELAKKKANLDIRPEPVGV